MRRFTFWAVALAVLVIVLFNVQGWLVLGRTSRVLEQELGSRLEATATILARVTGCGWQSPDRCRLLADVMRDNDLFNVFIISESLQYLANFRDSTLSGQTSSALELDASEILAAFSGIPTQSRLYAAGSYYLKSAYAPLEDSTGTTAAVLGVEADARFFSILTGFRNSLILINILSLFAIAAVVLVSISLARHALSLEQAAGRASTMALLGQMSAAVAHDIKNPLGIIRASAERLKKKYGAGASDPTFDYIPEEVDRLSTVVSNYLTIGAARPGAPEPVDVAGLLQMVLHDMAHETGKHSVAVEANLENLPQVQGSRLELRQVFLNLVLNAIQAQPEGGAIRVTGRAERKHGRNWLVIAIADKGPGIRPEDRRRVFEPFFTTREKGSGLGLFSVRRIVEAHHGHVAIDSRPGSGTTVEVRLPI